MFKLSKNALLIFSVLVISASIVSAEEITITTYYPSPYGSYKNLNVYNQDESTTLTDFTQALTKAGLLITTDYTINAYTPGIFWSTQNNNATKPKAGIYLMETNTGTIMNFGTSNNYATGITNSAIVINEGGDIRIGGQLSDNSPTTKLKIIDDLSVSSANIGVWAYGYGEGGRFSGHDTGVHAMSSVGSGVLSWGQASDFYAYGPGVDYNSSSSIRWKQNIKPIDNALASVLNLRGVYFDWDTEHGSRHDLGFIGEEVAKYFPEIVNFDEKNNNYVTGMDYGRMTPILLEAIKQLKAEIDVLKKEVEYIKEENKEIKSKLEITK